MTDSDSTDPAATTGSSANGGETWQDSAGPASEQRRDAGLGRSGRLVFSLGFLGSVTTALTIPLMAWRYTHSSEATFVALNLVVWLLIILWITRYT